MAKSSENDLTTLKTDIYEYFKDAVLSSDWGSAHFDFKLDTREFNDICAQYEKQVEVFRELEHRVNSTLDAISERWEGKGERAFKNQAKNIRQNLKDIMDIVIEMKDILIKSGRGYTELDSQIGKQMETNE